MEKQSQQNPADKTDEPADEGSDFHHEAAGTGTPDDARSWGTPDFPAKDEDE